MEPIYLRSLIVVLILCVALSVFILRSPPNPGALPEPRSRALPEDTRASSKELRDRPTDTAATSNRTQRLAGSVVRQQRAEGRAEFAGSSIAPGPKPQPVVFYRLIENLENEDWEVRWEAVNELGKLGDERAIPALVGRALYDDNDHPRWRSLWALKAVDPTGSQAIPLLRDALHDYDEVVARNAAVALAFFGQPEGRVELLRGLDDQDSFRRWEAIYSLRRVGNREVADELIRLLEQRVEPEVRVRSEAALALGYMGGPAVIPPLVDALRNDESAQVRWRAAMTLSKVGDASIVGALEEVMKVERDPQVREHVEVALSRVRKLRSGS